MLAKRWHLTNKQHTIMSYHYEERPSALTVSRSTRKQFINPLTPNNVQHASTDYRHFSTALLGIFFPFSVSVSTNKTKSCNLNLGGGGLQTAPDILIPMPKYYTSACSHLPTIYGGPLHLQIPDMSYTYYVSPVTIQLSLSCIPLYHGLATLYVTSTTTQPTLLRHTQNTQPYSPTLAHAMYLIASQFTVRNDVTDSHLLSVTFVWHSSVCIPLTSCKSMKGDSLSTHIIKLGTYFF